MKHAKRDLIFAIAIIATLAVLFLGTGKKLGKDVPSDEDHLTFYQLLEKGEDRITLEKGCVVCHALDSLSQAHPHKEECMVCHQPKNDDSSQPE